jgi:hypothetical protein
METVSIRARARSDDVMALATTTTRRLVNGLDKVATVAPGKLRRLGLVKETLEIHMPPRHRCAPLLLLVYVVVHPSGAHLPVDFRADVLIDSGHAPRVEKSIPTPPLQR